MGPPPRSLAADAHDCIMVWMIETSSSSHTEYKVVAEWPRHGRLASDCLVAARCHSGGAAEKRLRPTKRMGATPLRRVARKAGRASDGGSEGMARGPIIELD